MPSPGNNFRYEDKFRYFPPPRPGIPYGPTEFQKTPWIENMPKDIRPHYHDLDILLLLGGSRSGKSIAATARCAYVARNYPGAKIYVGSLNFNHLEKTTVNDFWKPMFSVDGGEWNHPSVISKPTRENKRLKIRTRDGKGISTVTFMNLEQYLKMLGTEADIWHIEEPELLRSNDALQTIMTRLSSHAVPFKQIMLTANPTAELDWLIDWFKLEQFEDGYTGEKIPIGDKCNCQYCVACENSKNKMVPYVDGFCPECGYIKHTKCPGGQYFQRVVISDPSMNPHNTDNYVRDMKSTLNRDNKAAFVTGLVFRRKKGAFYPNYSGRNVYPEDKPIDPDKPLIWTHDFNRMPMCSVLCQEWLDDNERVHVDILDEIIVRNSGPEEVAAAFIDKYAGWYNGLIKIYGDPMGFTGHKKGKELDRFNKLVQILQMRGFNVELKAYPTVYYISKRRDSVNAMLCTKDIDGTELIRMHINPRCEWTRLSLEKTVWDSSGKKEDERNDKKYRDKSKPDEMWALTHPACALGYFIVEEHPYVNGERPPLLIHNVGSGRLVKLTDQDKLTVEQITKKDIEEYKREIEKKQRDELEAEDRFIDSLRYRNSETSLADSLRSIGMWKLG